MHTRFVCVKVRSCHYWLQRSLKVNVLAADESCVAMSTENPVASDGTSEGNVRLDSFGSDLDC